MILVLPPSLPCYLALFHVISQASLRALLMPGVRLDCSGNTEKYETCSLPAWIVSQLGSGGYTRETMELSIEGFVSE